MLDNFEFKDLKNYDKIIEQIPCGDTKYSIHFHILQLISEGKSRLYDDFGYKDDTKIFEVLFMKLSDLQITSPDTFNLGEESSGTWLVFEVLEDGHLKYLGYRAHRKVGPNDMRYC